MSGDPVQASVGAGPVPIVPLYLVSAATLPMPLAAVLLVVCPVRLCDTPGCLMCAGLSDDLNVRPAYPANAPTPWREPTP